MIVGLAILVVGVPRPTVAELAAQTRREPGGGTLDVPQRRPDVLADTAEIEGGDPRLVHAGADGGGQKGVVPPDDDGAGVADLTGDRRAVGVAIGELDETGQGGVEVVGALAHQ